jgi:hypothetical protein
MLRHLHSVLLAFQRVAYPMRVEDRRVRELAVMVGDRDSSGSVVARARGGWL